MLVELHGEGGLSSFGSSYINSQNKEQPEFKLPKREALILVSGDSFTLYPLSHGACNGAGKPRAIATASRTPPRQSA